MPAEYAEGCLSYAECAADLKAPDFKGTKILWAKYAKHKFNATEPVHVRGLFLHEKMETFVIIVPARTCALSMM